MRHRVAGYKLGRTTSHRRAMLRNMVTSIIMEERIETTVIKAKAVRPSVEKMITLGKKGDLAARRQAASYLMTGEAVTKLFDSVAPRFGDRNGGYTRIVRTAWRKGDGAEKAFIELLGSEQVLDEKRQKRSEAFRGLLKAIQLAEHRAAIEQRLPRAGLEVGGGSQLVHQAVPQGLPRGQKPPLEDVIERGGRAGWFRLRQGARAIPRQHGLVRSVRACPRAIGAASRADRVGWGSTRCR